MIDFENITKLFNKDWDFSYLTAQEMDEVLNQPIKTKNQIDNLKIQGKQYTNKAIFLVIIKHTCDYDYTLTKEFKDILGSEVLCEHFDCNYKYAVVKSGLGQYARNSLVYHPIFKFDTHITIFLFKDGISNLPERKEANFNLLNLCLNCDDCIKSCPVNAIQQDSLNRTWINLEKCDNFCHFGNHGKIPSIKWNLVKLNKLNLSYKEIYDIIDFPTWINTIGNQGENLPINCNTNYVIFPICRECTSQRRCTKYNGKYPYDWNNIKVIQKES